MRNDVVEFWNSRAQLGEAAGTNDVMLKRLEIAELLRRVPESSLVLDVGCGNGITLDALSRLRDCSGVGIDISPQMIMGARRTVWAPRPSFTEFKVCDITKPESLRILGDDAFEVAVSERCLINLASPEEQFDAFLTIMDQLAAGGRYFMIENSVEGLARLNALRAAVDLPAMKTPWHNLYLQESTVGAWATKEYVLEEVVPFTSTYYFLSRVVYARLAADESKEPEYESPINQLSLQLPAIGDCGATRLWVWRRD